MEIERAIEILNPEHREHYDSIETVNEACRMGMRALEKQVPKRPYLDNDNGIYESEYCPTCNRKLFPNDHHCKCGQALDWSNP